MRLTIGAKMNNLDTFNKDKIKCKKCKEHFDKIDDASDDASKIFMFNGIKTLRNADLCEDCNVIWAKVYWKVMMNWKDEKINFKDWCNNEQT